jgi:hypothetical protein
VGLGRVELPTNGLGNLNGNSCATAGPAGSPNGKATWSQRLLEASDQRERAVAAGRSNLARWEPWESFAERVYGGDAIGKSLYARLTESSRPAYRRESPSCQPVPSVPNGILFPGPVPAHEFRAEPKLLSAINGPQVFQKCGAYKRFRRAGVTPYATPPWIETNLDSYHPGKSAAMPPVRLRSFHLRAFGVVVRCPLACEGPPLGLPAQPP